MRNALILATLASLAVACAPGGGPPPDNEVDRTVYPDGPFGNAEGQVLADLEFVRDTGESYTLDADIYADETKRLLLLTTAAGWCTACIEEQGQLEQFHNQSADDGLAIVVSYFQDDQFQPAQPSDAAGWRQTHGLTFDVVSDAPFVLSDYYDENLTPMNMLVDIDTMEILRIQTGWDPSVVEAIIEARL